MRKTGISCQISLGQIRLFGNWYVSVMPKRIPVPKLLVHVALLGKHL